MESLNDKGISDIIKVGGPLVVHGEDSESEGDKAQIRGICSLSSPSDRALVTGASVTRPGLCLQGAGRKRDLPPLPWALPL